MGMLKIEKPLGFPPWLPGKEMPNLDVCSNEERSKVSPLILGHGVRFLVLGRES